MFSLDKRIDDLWKGGPWEQPSSPALTPPSLQIPAKPRPVLRVRRRKRKWPIVLAVVLVILLAVAAAFAAGSLAVSAFYRYGTEMPFLPQDREHPEAQEYSTEPPSIPRAPTGTGVTLTLLPDTNIPLTYTQIYDKNAPSMVSIEAKCRNEYSTGTGVILTEDGYILTNAHVVAGAKEVTVIFFNNQTLKASLVGFDAQEDLAVLKVAASGLTPAEFGNSSALRCGDPVAALGDPLGYRSTITDGIVSALDREVTMDGVTMTLIQTSAAINFGNSGGALINQYGQVVGITTIKIITEDGSAEALGFAIPSQRVKYVTDGLIAGKEIRTGVFGFTVFTLPAEEGGLELKSVDPASDAHAKGLQAGDIILTVNDQPVTAIQDLSRVKLSLGPGDTVTLTYLRDGQIYTVDVALVDAETISN